MVMAQEYSIVNEVNLDSLIRHVENLSGERTVTINGNPVTIQSRHANYPGNDLAADYIQQQLQSYGLLVINHNYSATGRNVLAVQTGSEFPDMEIILGAHYDSMPENNFSPGADDNASGVAAVLEAARILSNYDNRYTLIYALWDEEELGVLGSIAYATEASTTNEQILCNVNVDMIGWDSDDDGIFLINTMDHSLAYSNAALSTISRFDIGLTPQIVIPGYGSDNLPFWWNGFPAIGIEEDYFNDWNANYHTIDDRIGFFNLSYFHNCAKDIIGTVAALAQGYREFSEIVINDTLRDTEDIYNPFPITVTISETSEFPLNLTTLSLISGLDSSFSDTTIMTNTDDPDIYTGNIPVPGAAGVMSYYASAITLNDLEIREPYGAPIQNLSFIVGPDHIFPQIEYISIVEDQLYPVGSEDIIVRARDNIGVQSVDIFWMVNNGDMDSTATEYLSDEDYYIGTIAWSSLQIGDEIDYWVRVADQSLNSNSTESTVQNFSITRNYLIGDFENMENLTRWNLGQWGSQFLNAEYGICINDSPESRYEANAYNPCNLIEPLNLTYFDQAYIHFTSVHDLEQDQDFGYVQISIDGDNWETHATVTGLWEIEEIYVSLDDFLMEDAVYLRLLMVSDNQSNYFGWFVDDIELVLNTEMPVVSINDGTVGKIDRFSLSNNYPNPFNPTTTINYGLPIHSDVQITISDLLGREVTTLVSESQAAGYKSVNWNGKNNNGQPVSAGVYFYQIKAGSFVQTKKMILLR